MAIVAFLLVLPWATVSLRNIASDDKEILESDFDHVSSSVDSLLRKLETAGHISAELREQSLMELHERKPAHKAKAPPHEWFSCGDFCVKCAGNGKTWKIHRSTSTGRKFGMVATVAGGVALTLTALSGVIISGGALAWVAGAPVAVLQGLGLGATTGAAASGAGLFAGAAGAGAAISSTGWLGILSGAGAGFILKDMLMGSRRCPHIWFQSSTKEDPGMKAEPDSLLQNSTFRSTTEAPVENDSNTRGAKYHLEDIYFIELIGQMKVTADKEGHKVKVLDSDRDELTLQRRLSALMACGIMTQAQNRFAYMGIQLPDMANLSRKYDGISEGVVAACGRWLCVEMWPESVHKPKWLGWGSC